MKKIFAIGATALTLAACAPGYHHDHMGMRHERMMEHYFNQMDANHDGVISWKESQAFSRTRFKEADADHNGVVTLEEFTSYKMREKEEMRGAYKGRHHDVDDDRPDRSEINQNEYR